MSEPTLIYIRNTVSGVTEALSPEEAAHILSHGWFGKFHVQVDSEKSEILEKPYRVDEDGERVYIDENAEDLSDAKQAKADAVQRKAEEDEAAKAAEDAKAEEEANSPAQNQDSK